MHLPDLPDTARTVALSPVLDREAAAHLLPELRDGLATGALRIDAEKVERIGQTGLQLLLSASLTARAGGAEFAIAAPSPALCRAAQIAGLSDALNLPEAD